MTTINKINNDKYLNQETGTGNVKDAQAISNSNTTTNSSGTKSVLDSLELQSALLDNNGYLNYSNSGKYTNNASLMDYIENNPNADINSILGDSSQLTPEMIAKETIMKLQNSLFDDNSGNDGSNGDTNTYDSFFNSMANDEITAMNYTIKEKLAELKNSNSTGTNTNTDNQMLQEFMQSNNPLASSNANYSASGNSIQTMFDQIATDKVNEISKLMSEKIPQK